MYVSSLGEFVVAVDATAKTWNLSSTSTIHPWYRGQADFTWELLPSIYRFNGDNFYERELIRDFKLNTLRFIEHYPNNELEWLFIMQHYGMPTRLIDWSESYLIALYFAVLNYKNQCDACVWILDAWSLNECVLNEITVPISEHPLLLSYFLKDDPSIYDREVIAELPCALRPKRNTPRIIAQKGVFTIHGKDCRSLNKIIDEKNANSSKSIRYKKINISGSCKKTILIQLMQAGINHSVLFPEMEACAKELSFRYSNEYIGNRGHKHAGF